jgi:hypothetical protein
MEDSTIIIIIIIIISVYFIFNYDIHVVPKNTKLNDITFVEKEDAPIIKIEDIKNNNVINEVMKVLENIPSELTQQNMQKIVSYLNNLYQTSKNYSIFQEKIKNDIKMQEYPYNTNYSKIVENLIIKFDKEYKQFKSQIKKKVQFNDTPQVKILPRKDAFDNVGQIMNFSPF